MYIVLFLGAALLLGMRHALEPDHLVAVSTLVAEEHRMWPAARLGLIWGLGHQLPITLLGLPALALRLEMPKAFDNLVDLAVGVLLLVLGILTLWRLRRSGVHVHAHSHDGSTHAHFHAHESAASREASGHGHPHPMPGRDRRGQATFGIGLLHGLGGSGAAAALAVTAAPSVHAGLGYLFCFAVGTCLGMFLLTLCVAAPAITALSQVEVLHRTGRAVAGLASIAFGLYMWYNILPKLLA